MDAHKRDDSSIDILEFIDSDDDSLFIPEKEEDAGTKTTKPPTQITVPAARTVKENAQAAKKIKVRRKRKPKPADMPRRPLSAYNIFFKAQRALIIGAKPPNPFDDQRTSRVSSSDGSPTNFERKKRAHRKTHGKISFSQLAKEIGKKWNALAEEGRAIYVAGAAKEKLRYQEELRIYKLKKGAESKGIKKNCVNKSGMQARTSNRNHEDNLSQERFERFQRYPRTSSEQTSTYHRHEVVPSSFPIIDSPHGLDVEFASRSSSPPTIKQEQEDYYSGSALEDFNPLPITYDPRCNPTEHINNSDMLKLVAPLLNRTKAPRGRGRGRLPTRNAIPNNIYNNRSDSNAYADMRNDCSNRIVSRRRPSFKYQREEEAGLDGFSRLGHQGHQSVSVNTSTDNLLNLLLTSSSEEKKHDQGSCEDYPSDYRSSNQFSI
jgi:hypothetical protein